MGTCILTTVHYISGSLIYRVSLIFLSSCTVGPSFGSVCRLFLLFSRLLGLFRQLTALVLCLRVLFLHHLGLLRHLLVLFLRLLVLFRRLVLFRCPLGLFGRHSAQLLLTYCISSNTTTAVFLVGLFAVVLFALAGF